MAGQPSSYSGKPPQQTRTTPSQYDYATLYEEWLLQAQQQQQNANDNNNNSYVSAMAMRAGRLGAMQCAIMDSATEKTDFLSGLLKRMELDEDLVVVDKNKKNNSHNQRMLPLPLATLEQNTSCKKKNNERNLASVADVDAFFEAYPECIRPGWEEYDDTSSSSSEEEELRPSRRKKRPLEKEKTPPAKLPEVAAPPHANYQSHSFSHLQQKPFGMESKHSNNYPQQQQQQQQPQPIYNATQTWEETHPQQEISAFQTAKEFAQSNGDYVPPPHRQQHQQRTSTNSVNEYHQYNPYQQQQPQEHEPPSNSPLVKPQGPLIRDSLKRKFQPPKRGAAAASNSSRGGEHFQQASSKSSSSGGMIKRKPDNNKKTSPSNGVGHDDDDDDLPEELKRYGKDLVEKIQSEIMDQGEPITFHDIAGLEDAKSTIQEIVIWPMKRPDLFTGLRRTPNGLLLFGPPGTGKTLIGKAIAHESGATFFSISSSSLTSKWVGEGEKLVRTLFGVAAYNEPSVVFIDEIDSLLTQRKADENESSRRIKTEFLVQLDGTGTSGQGRVLVIGATNRPQELDEAARRRFVKRLYIPLPDTSDRCCLLKVLLEKNLHTLSQSDVEKLAADTDGFSGADLKALCADAAMGPIRQLGSRALDITVEELPPISYKHFRQSLRGMRPSVSAEDIKQYIEFDKTYGSKRAAEEEEEEIQD